MKEKIISLLEKETKLSKKEIETILEIPPSQELGDYAFPCFILSKNLKKNPVQIAQDLSNKISDKNIEKVEAKGPYLNFFLNSQELTKKTLSKILKEKDKYGKKKSGRLVLIESPGPNTNKPLHLGHIRNIILAQSVQNILKFGGDKVKIVNINNDRGVHICKSMLAYEKFGNKKTPESENIKSDHFVGDYYVKFAQESKKDPKLEMEVQKSLQKWESGDRQTLETWKKMNRWAFDGFKKTYKKFDLKIDKEYYESKIYKKGKEIIFEQQKKGVVKTKEDGAIFIDLTSEGLGEKILLRGDGTAIYITMDLHLAVERKKEFNFDKTLYVVANEQNHHFKVLFETLKKFGYKWAKDLQHLNYGMVLLESGRMKSREGTVVDADDLIFDLEEMAKKELDARYPKLSKTEKSKRAQVIAMAALRYHFLRIDRGKDTIFKPEESISFEGNTGPYLLYTYARAKSILAKSKIDQTREIPKDISPIEKSLISQLAAFPQVTQNSFEQLAPNLIANYAFQLAQTFNEFYHSTKVIGSENESFLLTLVKSFSIVLKSSLNLLDIQVLETM